MEAKVDGDPDQAIVPLYWALLIDVTGDAPVTGAVTPVIAAVVIVVSVAGKRIVKVLAPPVYVDVMPLTVKKLFASLVNVNPLPAVKVMVAV